MPVSIRYPSVVPTVDASGLADGLSALGEKIGQRRQEKRDLAEAEKLFGQILGGEGSLPQRQGAGLGAMSLADLVPTKAITRSPLPDIQDNPTRRVAEAHQTSDPMPGYFQATRSSESGGDDLAKNPNSSATGRYQFTAPTWDDLMRSNPELGLTAEGRTDPRQQEAAVRAFTANNAKQLSRGGVPVNPGSLYAAHFLGAGGATGAYGQDDATPMTSVVGPEVIQANPFLGNMSVGDFKSWAGEKAGYASPGAGPSQSALEGLAVGRSMSMDGGGAQPSQGQGISTGGFGVDPKIMAAALKNPYTRPFAIEMAKSRMAAMADQNDPMKRVAYEKALVDLENARNPKPKMTDDMAEYLYAQKNPQFGQYQIDQKRAASTQVNVGSEKGYDKTVGEGYGKRFLDIQDGAQTAQRAINALDVMEQAMADPGFYSGAGAGAVTNLKRFGRALGMDVEGIADAESFNAMSKQAALDSMGGSLGTGFSNADRDFVLDQVPNLQNTPEGNARLIDIQRKMNMRRQQIAQLAREYAAQNGGRIDAGFDDALSRWSEANPLFPAQPAGSGANRGAGGANGRQRARNPQTGETLEWDGTKWSPVR